MNLPFSVYGGMISGFQRYDVNNSLAIVISVVVALINVVVLLAGYGLVTLVAATTVVRVLAFFVYRRNAYRVFPELRIRPSLFRRARLKEVTGFSIYASIIDWANKLNYQIDQVIIGMFLGSAAVAVWAPAERIVSGVQRLTNQLNGVLFPTIVDSDASQQQRRLQQILLRGTSLSLAMVMPISAALVMLADPLIHAWLGKQAEAVRGCIPVLQILAVTVVVRVGGATSNTLLKGSGKHRQVAWVNLSAGVVNAVLSMLLIRRWGLVGVAWGTFDTARVHGRVHSIPGRLPPRGGSGPPRPDRIRPARRLARAPRGSRARPPARHLIRHASGCGIHGNSGGPALPCAVLHRGD